MTETELVFRTSRAEDVALLQSLAQRLGISVTQKVRRVKVPAHRKPLTTSDHQKKVLEGMKRLSLEFSAKYEIQEGLDINKLIDEMNEL